MKEVGICFACKAVLVAMFDFGNKKNYTAIFLFDANREISLLETSEFKFVNRSHIKSRD